MPRHEMGVVAMRKLHNRMATEREPAAKIVLYGELIVRESTAGV
jgi:DNA-binding LacI/PurR family transcriptional regulator